MSQLYKHPSIQCVSDESMAIEYLMPDGNRVLAYCHKSAKEFYDNRPRQAELPLREREQTLFEQ